MPHTPYVHRIYTVRCTALVPATSLLTALILLENQVQHKPEKESSQTELSTTTQPGVPEASENSPYPWNPNLRRPLASMIDQLRLVYFYMVWRHRTFMCLSTILEIVTE